MKIRHILLMVMDSLMTLCMIAFITTYFLNDVNKIKSIPLDNVLVNNLSVNQRISESEYKTYKEELEKSGYSTYFNVYKNGEINLIYVHVNGVDLSIHDQLNQFETVDDVISILGDEYIEIYDGYNTRLTYYDKEYKTKFSIEYFDDRQLEWISLSKYSFN